MKGNNIESYLPVENMLYIEGFMMYQGDGANRSSEYNSFLRMFISPDYSLKDIHHAIYMENPSQQIKIHKLLNELYEVDETKNMEQVKVPLLILRGDHDVFGPPEFFKGLPDKNSNITYMEVSNCGHIPGKIAFEKIQEEIIKFGKK